MHKTTESPTVLLNSKDAQSVHDLLTSILPLVTSFIEDGQTEGARVVEGMRPLEVQKLLPLRLPEEGTGAEGAVVVAEAVLDHSVKTWNVGFLDKLYAATDAVGVASELLLGVLNANVHVYAASPAVTLVEIAMLQAFGRLLGFGDEAGGLFCPGGSASNMLSLVTARNRAFPHVKEEGYREGEKPAIFTSAHSHYSVDKAAGVLAIGSRRVYKVACGEDGRMSIADLEAKIALSKERGETPFYINATAGTTVLAAFDPFREIARIAKANSMWMHVDGSWGGPVCISREHGGLMEGVEGADSVTLNPHKLLGTPLQCSLLVTRDPTTLQKHNSLSAKYLFHGSSFDLGDGGIGCGRRGDALKIFMAWHYHGRAGLAERVDTSFTHAAHLEWAVASGPHGDALVLAAPRQSINVCFWVLPPWLRGKRGKSWVKEVSSVTTLLHAQLQSEGIYMIDYAPLPDKPLCFRVPCHRTAGPKVLDGMLDRLVTLANAMCCESDLE